MYNFNILNKVVSECKWKGGKELNFLGHVGTTASICHLHHCDLMYPFRYLHTSASFHLGPLFSKLNCLSLFHPSKERHSSPSVILVAFQWTPSSSYISFMNWGAQRWTSTPGVASPLLDREEGLPSSDLLAKLLSNPEYN